VFFLGILSIQCKIRRDRPTDTRRSTGRSRSTCWPPLFYSIVNFLIALGNGNANVVKRPDEAQRFYLKFQDCEAFTLPAESET